MTEETLNTTDSGATSAEGNSVGADLDTILAQYDTAPKTPAPSPDLRKLQPVIDFATEELTTRANERVQMDVKAAVEFVKQVEGGDKMTDRLTRGFLEGKASEDPAFKDAFQNRQNNPTGWQTALAGAQTEFAKEISSLPSNNIKSDAEAARAAVAGGVETPGDQQGPSPVEMGQMSEQDFEALRNRAISENERQ